MDDRPRATNASKEPRARASGRVIAVAVAVVIAAACGAPATTSLTTVAPATAGPQGAPSTPSSTPAQASSPSASPTAAPSFALLGKYPAGPLSGTRAAALQRVLEDAVASGAPDAIAAVVTPDGTWSGAAGIGGPDGRKATPTDEFYIASLTKMFTSALVMRLVEDRKMDLDAPLAEYLGDLKVDTNKATVRQALGMLSGLPDYPSNAADAIAMDPGHRWTTEELIDRFFIPPTKSAGSTYIYGNPGYLLLAIAAEHVTGMSYAKALRKLVLDPVGATRLLDQGAGVVTPKPWAIPTVDHMGSFETTDFGKGGVISCISSVSFSVGGGSMAGDAPSVAAWTWHLFAGDVVGKASLELMLPAAEDMHGLGVERLTDLGASPVVGQTGAKTGYGSILAFFPDARVLVVLFVNDPDFIVEPTVRSLFDAAIQK